MRNSTACRFVAATSLVALLGWSSALAVPSDTAEKPPSETADLYDQAEEFQNGVTAMEEGDYAAAEAAFDKVVFVTPDSAEARYMLGLARAGQDKLFPARVAFESALHYDPDHIGASRELGVTLARQGNEVRAQEQLDALKARAETCAGTCDQAADLDAAVSAVEAALGGGDQAALVAPARLVFASGEAGDAAYLEAVGLINEGRHAEAIDALETAEQAFGPHPDVLTYLGFASRKLGRFDDAERYYQAALAAEPTHKGATEYYGELKVEQGDIEAAERLLARLDALCDFGCAEADELRRWIDDAGS